MIIIMVPANVIQPTQPLGPLAERAGGSRRSGLGHESSFFGRIDAPSVGGRGSVHLIPSG